MITTANIRKFAIFCLAGIAFYSHTLASNPSAILSFQYQSVGGDAGIINLEMHDDNTFTLEMVLLDFNNNRVSLQGTWSEDETGEELHLTFTGQQPILDALFTSNMITGNNSIKIHKNAQEIWIYHTLCKRTNTKELYASKAKS